MAGGDEPALRQVLMAAKACFLFGLVAAVIGLVAATSNPGDFQFHAESQIGHAAAHQIWAATEVEALGLREAALTLVLLGVAEVLTAAAAVVVLAGGSLTFHGRWLVANALVLSATNTYHVYRVVYRVALVAGGQLPDVWTQITIASSVVTFFLAGLTATLCA